MFKFSRLAIYFLALNLVFLACSDDEDDNMRIAISGLDFSITADASTPNTVSVTPSATNADSYSVDFGDPNSSNDVLSSNGESVSYTYPEETATYTITVIASGANAAAIRLSKSYTVMIPNNIPPDNADLVGKWRLAQAAGALGVGPERGSTAWWTSGDGEVTARACLFDDEYVFNADGTFQNVLGDDTWVEPWQGNDPEGCAAPVAPHDGTASAEFVFNKAAGTLALNGKGAFLGLAKVFNGGELGSPSEAVEQITYQASLAEGNQVMTLEIEIAGGGWWTFVLWKEGFDTGPSNDNALIEGSWLLVPEAGALGVGPARGSTEWWTSSSGDVTARDCLFDDEYVFNADGSFQNVMGDATWVETWQGRDAEGCDAPVSPHDGSSSATYEFIAADGTLKISGTGAYMGLAKVFNGGELSSPADAKSEITYQATLSDDQNRMTLEIEIAGGGWWTFNFVRKEVDMGGSDCSASAGITGTWKMAPEAAALAVGPNRGSSEWWSNSAGDVTTRDCFFDDEYVFNADGTFQNILGDNTWTEPWQGMDPEGCATAVAPHDGSAVATYVYDEDAGTVTLTGKGAYLGLAKVINGAELASPADAPEEVTYEVSFSEDNCLMTVEIDFGGGWWTYRLSRQ